MIQKRKTQNNIRPTKTFHHSGKKKKWKNFYHKMQYCFSLWIFLFSAFTAITDLKPLSWFSSVNNPSACVDVFKKPTMFTFITKTCRAGSERRMKQKKTHQHFLRSSSAVFTSTYTIYRSAKQFSEQGRLNCGCSCFLFWVVYVTQSMACKTLMSWMECIYLYIKIHIQNISRSPLNSRQEILIFFRYTQCPCKSSPCDTHSVNGCLPS